MDLKVGQRVLIHNLSLTDTSPRVYGLMPHYLAKKAIITQQIGNNWFKLDVDNGNFSWDKGWLVPIAQEEQLKIGDRVIIDNLEDQCGGPGLDTHGNMKRLLKKTARVTEVWSSKTAPRVKLDIDNRYVWHPAWLKRTTDHLKFLGLCDSCGGINLHQTDCSESGK